MDPQALRDCLACLVCHLPLRAPTTLACGHTVCATHPTVPCPLHLCNILGGPSRPRIPRTSRVKYLPPPPAPLATVPVAEPKLDVTLSKIIALLDSVLQDKDEDSADRDEPFRSSNVRQRADTAGPPDRPRKRQRLEDGAGDLLTHLLTSSAHPGETSHRLASPAHQRETFSCAPLLGPTLEKHLLSELSCEICFMLLYNPVTTPCQHTFCAICLHRSLDHSNLCPLCRTTLPGFSFFEDHPPNQTLQTLLLAAFPDKYTERAETIDTRDGRLDTPIFVCMLIFPGHPTALHFFEPRYRLMLRRCLEQQVPSFGMVMPARRGAASQNPTDYGTMLEVRSVQMLADGRSMVETWSTYRFRILARGTRDGYTVARIERCVSSLSSFSFLTPRCRIDDVPDALTAIPALVHASNAELMDICTAFLHQLRRGTARWVVQRLDTVYGPPPSDPAAFSFWIALVLPIDEHEKAKLLPMRSAHMRLRLVVHWIEQLNSTWWFASGCVIM
ncbi:PUA-like domain-containing protein [Mycena rosella]|uniref:PUA-like domain-containing protein n=1 Tax=Mycena rosella TaxID=1033263 RepID=A0AAD7GJ59_MYCRO|nr:PUA-like domain-containing protein [Mycena rosella]